jgi:hypothetical protein
VPPSSQGIQALAVLGKKYNLHQRFLKEEERSSIVKDQEQKICPLASIPWLGLFYIEISYSILHKSK